MKTLSVYTTVNEDSGKCYELIADFEQYPTLAPSVKSVEISDVRGNTCVSQWEVDFRDGTLRWSERDIFDKPNGCIRFEQIEGDMESFSGKWQIEALGNESTKITFQSTFDLGLPSLDAFLEPVAGKVLEENIEKLMQGLFSNLVEIG